ncbi:MAG: FtsK/SpoIIIE domain-containing protein, partial [Verrucomicrobiota bacterium]
MNLLGNDEDSGDLPYCCLRDPEAFRRYELPSIDLLGIPEASSLPMAGGTAPREVVQLAELFQAPEFSRSEARIPMALGRDLHGNALVKDLAELPHLIMAGSTGSGKSACLHSILTSLLFHFTPRDLRLILVDTMVSELETFQSLPHLALPMVTNPIRALQALRWSQEEAERRHQLFARYGCKSLDAYIQLHHSDSEGVPSPLPPVVIIIDELANMMQIAPKDFEAAINHLCRSAAGAGIHLIMATQSPRRDILTELIRAPMKARVGFHVASSDDSQIILDQSGAEKLVGKGDLLFLPPDSTQAIRAQGAFLTEDEIQRVVTFCSQQGSPVFDPFPKPILEEEEFTAA